MSDDPKVVAFTPARAAPPDSEEAARMLVSEAHRLAKLPPYEWPMYVAEQAHKHGKPPETLTAMVKAIVAEQDKAKAKAAKEEAERGKRQEREAAKRAKDREKDKDKTFKRLKPLPSEQQEAGLAELASRIETAECTLSEEFEAFVGPPPCASCTAETPLWEEPVEARTLLPEIIAELRRYAVVDDHQMITAALWPMFAWVHEIATHSPLLVVTSGEIDSGKSTLLGLMKWLAPRAIKTVEASAASVYSLIDSYNATLIHDENDTLLERNPTLRHIIFEGWTRGSTVPRKIGGRTYLYQIFGPKALGLKYREDGTLALPEAATSRSIIIKTKPKLASEKVEDFDHQDNETLANLRSKLARWSTDNMESLKSAKPEIPDAYINRLRQNWWLMLAIAESADMAKPARLAAINISSQKITRPSKGKQLLNAIWTMLARRDEISSEKMLAELRANEDVDFRYLNQWTMAAMLRGLYDISPKVIRSPGGKPYRGYKTEWFTDAFKRQLGKDRHSANVTQRKASGGKASRSKRKAKR
jgi:hypothetical protein